MNNTEKTDAQLVSEALQALGVEMASEDVLIERERSRQLTLKKEKVRNEAPKTIDRIKEIVDTFPHLTVLESMPEQLKDGSMILPLFIMLEQEQVCRIDVAGELTITGEQPHGSLVLEQVETNEYFVKAPIRAGLECILSRAKSSKVFRVG